MPNVKLPTITWSPDGDNNTKPVVGTPVQFDKLPLDGVPSAGVTNVGLVTRAIFPLPDTPEASAVATPVPNPVKLAVAYPVQLDNVPLEGVPNTGVVNDGETVPAKLPVPDAPLKPKPI